MVGASYDSVSMVEGEFDEISESEMTEAINLDMRLLKYKLMLKKVNEIGQKETREYESAIENEDLLKKVQDECYENCYQMAKKVLVKVIRVF